MPQFHISHPSEAFGILHGWTVYLLAFGAAAVIACVVLPLRVRRAALGVLSLVAVGVVFSPVTALSLLVGLVAYWGLVQTAVSLAAQLWNIRWRAYTSWGLLAALLATYYALLPGYDFMGLAHWAGIAYGMPRALDYLAGRMEGRVTDGGLPAFLHYMLYFPGLMQGPIARSDVFLAYPIPKVTWAGVRSSLRLLAPAYGKYLVAMLLFAGRPFDLFYATPQGHSVRLLLYVATVAPCGYLFFAAYSDVARAMALILNQDLPENFRNPFANRSTRSFWRDYHISLSQWLRDYVYIPMGGNRRHRFLNNAAVFAYIALWHKPTLAFLLWGMTQSAAITAENALDSLRKRFHGGGWWRESRAAALLTAAAGFLTFWVWQSFSWSFFYADIPSVLRLWKAILLHW